MSIINRADIPLDRARNSNSMPDQTEIVTDADGLLWSVANIKEAIPVNHSEDDSFIEKIINAVTRRIEKHLGIDTLKKTRRSYWFHPNPVVILPYGPHGDINEVVTIDSEGNETALTLNDDYYVIGMKYKRLKIFNLYTGWPTSGYLRVEYVSGTTAANVGSDIKGGILQEILLQYKNRADPDTPGMTSVNGLSIEARHLLPSPRPKI